MVAWKVAVFLPILSASIRVNDEAIKLVEDAGVQQKHQKVDHQKVVTDPEVPAEGEEKADPCGEAISTAVTRNSAWRRTDKCKCPKGQMLIAEGTDCEENGRYFSAEATQGKGYTCGECSLKCGEVVEGAVERNSEWRQLGSRPKCKCTEKDHVVKGEDEACATHEGGRYFTRKAMRNKGCACMSNSTTQEAEVTPAPTNETAAPVTAPKEGGSGGAARTAGGLAMATLLVTLLAGSHQ